MGQGLPLVCVDREIAAVEVDTIAVDNGEEALTMVRHMVASGADASLF
jgi:DNA-binding LacI/PurR family transcriptional regulator